jgi:hypothetical protein
MRTGNLSSLTERDWASVRERRAFEQAEREKQLLAEDQIEYEKYVQIVHDDQQRVAPAHRIAPIPLEEWRAFTDSSIGDPVLRGARATNEALLSKVRRDEAAEVEAERKQARESFLEGRPDTSWKIPASAAGLKMPIEQARDFAKTAATQFVKENPEYYATMNNFETIVAYLTTNGVNIPDKNVFAQAFSRLTELGLLEQRPATPIAETIPEPQEPQPDPEVLRQQKRNEYLTKVVVTDPRTGQGYTEYQLDRLPADEYKRLMIGEFKTPRITDVIKPAWYRH